MSFPPVSGVLDGFNRADEGPPPSASWTSTNALTGFGTGQLVVLSNQCKATTSGIGGAYWNLTDFNADCEVYATVSTLGANGQALRLYARLTDIGASTTDGYVLEFTPLAGTDTWKIFEITNGVLTQVGATATQDIVAGDGIGFDLVGSTLKGYRFNAAAWTEILSRTDSSHTAGGKIGMALQQTQWRVDDFGGGSKSITNPLTLTASAQAAEFQSTTRVGKRLVP
jgi:hypothetical protein